MASDVILPVLNRCRALALRSVTTLRATQDGWPPTAPDYYFEEWGPSALETVLSSDIDQLDEVEKSQGLTNEIAARASLSDERLGKELAHLHEGPLRQLLADCLQVICSHDVKKEAVSTWVGTKEVWAIDLVPMLSRCFPDARFISVVRDPRAVINSLVRLGQDDKSQLAHFPSYLRHWRKHVALSLNFRIDPSLRKRFLCLRYESLLRNPKDTVAALGEFLDEPLFVWDETCPRGTYLSDNSSFIRTMGNLKPERQHAWRSELSISLQECALAMVGPEMLLCGYEPRMQLELTSSPRMRQDLKTFMDSPKGKWHSSSGSSDTEVYNEMNRLSLIQLATDAISEASHQAILKNYLTDEVFTSVLFVQSLKQAKQKKFEDAFLI